MVEEADIPFDQLIRGEAEELLSDSVQRREHGLVQARNAFERQYILRSLKRCGWNQTDAARELKIHRNTLSNRMRSLNLRGDPTETAPAS
jgi:DNA-binding NtrC family response regulator